MCYERGLWQAYLDKEISGEVMTEMSLHLRECRSCKAILEELSADQEVVQSALGKYHNQVDRLNYSSRLGWEKFKKADKNESRGRRFWDMMGLSRKSVAAAAVVVILGGSLVFTPVRSMAAQFLQVFRVERITTVAISMEDIQRMQRELSDGIGKVDLKELGKIEFAGEREVQKTSLAEIKEEAQFPVRLPAYVPDGFANTDAVISKANSVTFTLNVEKVNQLITTLGGSKLFPESITGKGFRMDIPEGANLIYRNEETGKRIIFSQGGSPSLDVPGDVNAAEIRDAVLSLPVLPPNLKEQLTKINDWQRTMVIPNVEGMAQEIDVKGQKGVLIQQKDVPSTEFKFEEGQHKGGQIEVNGHKGRLVNQSFAEYRTLIWQENGIVYTISAPLEQAEMLKIAESMR